jgi:hypothetical protein
MKLISLVCIGWQDNDHILYLMGNHEDFIILYEMKRTPELTSSSSSFFFFIFFFLLLLLLYIALLLC